MKIEVGIEATARASMMAPHAETVPDVMGKLMDAHVFMMALRDRLVEALKTINPTTPDGKAKEEFVKRFARACDSLNYAVGILPDELFMLHNMGVLMGARDLIDRVKPSLEAA